MMSEKRSLKDVLAAWRLPKGDDLLDRIERMVRPALLAGYFGASYTRFVSGLQYHLGGAEDTQELAELSGISSSDSVLDVCCFIGGPALQLADAFRCKVTGIDFDRNAVTAAAQIARLAGLTGLLRFQVADASSLPFDKRSFTVVWNQCSLEHDETWLREFDRVLAPGGRLALTFQLKGEHADSTDDAFSKWRLQDLVEILAGMGYTVTHADDITERDIRIGWKALDKKLSEQEQEFASALGEEWVKKAHQEFQAEIEKMRDGNWGNGRVIAVKSVRP
jgi:ubiquinone/menaquinone biosynthesis C-methylase UbiE